ncbi:hypothetical protein [Bosea sp. LC85]|uniref:hypothetical protein n=1 Tax=Bosea sp. LC85 TaxID=1502851 RepID=UPI001FCB1D15|nr:hypothetical protein [Bosea sp. LC85]
MRSVQDLAAFVRIRACRTPFPSQRHSCDLHNLVHDPSRSGILRRTKIIEPISSISLDMRHHRGYFN